MPGMLASHATLVVYPGMIASHATLVVYPGVQRWVGSLPVCVRGVQRWVRALLGVYNGV